MNYLVIEELAQIQSRLNEMGHAIEDGGWGSEVVRSFRPEATALLERRRQLWNSQDAKDLGINGGVDHEIFY